MNIRRKRERNKSAMRTVMTRNTRSITVSFTISCPNIVSQHSFRNLIFFSRSFM